MRSRSPALTTEINMCVVSMILDHYRDEWRRRYIPQPILPMPGINYPIPVSPRGPTQEEVDEFRRLLDRAREYDKRNNEPDCEMDDKKRQLKELAEKLGVNISFIDE